MFFSGSYGAGAVAPVPEKIEFNRDVRPILSENCYYCHGPDPSHREAKLRLDVRDIAIEREAFVPGNAAESELILRIRSEHEDEVMPPPDSHKKLSARDKDVLERWVAQGAEYQQHWAYEKPVKAHVATGANGIDVLVARRLAERGMQPSPEADRRTLIRRLYADLIGLPPPAVEVAAFLADSNPKAVERLVDRLLASPRYGERMAMPWLDVVRFADTIGYHSDNPRNIWPYRDWVIQNFNTNKRFDRFTVEQIAGDLLPDASDETRVGSAFNRLLLTTEEGGAQPKDYEARMMADRVRAIGTAWLGQTTGCAQCHDHKFDPFTTRDFYSLGAFFADIKEAPIGRREEGLLLASQDQRARLAELDAALADARKKVAALDREINAAQAAWEAAGGGQPARAAEAEVEGIDEDAPNAAAVRRRSKQAQRAYFREKISQVGRAELDALAAAERAQKAYSDSLPRCLVSVASPTKRVVRVLPRGNWMDETGEIVRPALPAYLPGADHGDRELTRLDLAHWLVSRENPLTARVFVNRLWQQFFGVALSRVASDLGAQGELPANLPLLDWLACEFMDSGWDVKHIVRTIVTSRTYRQASTTDAAALAADPENREHARQSRFRLDAELVRDHALAVAGLLSPRIGGPSVKPYQPDRYWENLNFPTRQYVADRGDAQYRRGLYVWWQRTFLHPSMLAFDAPSREECTATRDRSNLPQQALVLLNDPTYVEAARVFAARILREGGATTAARLTFAWQTALQRDPLPGEVKTMTKLLDEHLQVYRTNGTAVDALLATGDSPTPPGIERPDVAAWTHVARVLFNLHEFITRS